MADEIDFGGKTLKNATLDPNTISGAGGTTTWKGDYDGNTTYSAGDVVVLNTTLYKATETVLGEWPDTTPAKWAVISGSGGGTTTWKSTHDYNASYSANDVVLYGGALWYALQSNQNQNPYSGSSYWGVLNAGSNLPNPTGAGQVLKSDNMYTWQTVTPPWILDPYGSEGFAGSPNNGATLAYSTSNNRWEIGSGGQLFALGSSSGDVQYSYGNNSASGGAATVSGGYSNTASGYNSTVSGGRNNIASDYRSTVGGGYNNTASGAQSTVSGGYNNNASGSNAFVGGGVSNTASAVYGLGTGDEYGDCAIVGGRQNNISSSGYRGFIGAGFSNTISGSGGVIVGGAGNTVSNAYSCVGGGYGNAATGQRCAVSGGYNNTASGNYSTVGGGTSNNASGTISTVSGGNSNTANGYASTVGGGRYDTASGAYSAVIGGRYNNASGPASIVGGGLGNTASGYRSTVSGGSYNTASGQHSSVLGGQTNNTNSFANAHIIGSGITADAADTTFVNNLKVVGVSGVGGITFADGSVQTTAASGGGTSLLISTSDNTAMMSVPGYLTQGTGLNYYANGAVASGPTNMASGPLGLALEPNKWYKMTVFLALDTGSNGDSAVFFIENGGSGAGYTAYGGFNVNDDSGYVSWDSMTDGSSPVIYNMSMGTTYTFGAHSFLLYSGDQTYIIPKFTSVGGGSIGLKTGSYFIAEKLG